MNGFKTWKHPEAVSAIHGLAPQLEDLFKAFLSGALETWEHFSSEFADDGTIAALTEAERDLAWIPATNDGNEGALGAYQVFAQKNPTGTLKLFNSIFRVRRNNTLEFMEKFLTGPEHKAFLRKEARSQDSMGLERKQRRKICNENIENAAKHHQKDSIQKEKRDERKRHLNGVEVEQDREKVARMMVKQLKDQLDKLRMADKQVPVDSRMKNKEEKLAQLLEALNQYEANICSNADAE